MQSTYWKYTWFVLHSDAIQSIEHNIIFIVLHLHKLSRQQLLQLRRLGFYYLDIECFLLDN